MQQLYTKFFLFALFGLFGSGLYAQAPIRVTSEFDEAKERFVIIGINDSQKSQSIVLMIENIDGLVPSAKLPALKTLLPGERRRLISLKRVGSSAPNFSIRFRYYGGTANPEINKEVRYVLPMTKGLTSRIRLAKDVKSIIDSNAPTKQIYSLSFALVDGDTICAAREGVVEQVKQEGQKDLIKYTFSGSRNYINVRHRDGTIGRYVQFKNGSALVKFGDRILAGTPLAIAQQSTIHGEALFFFSVTYLKVQIDALKAPEDWVDLKYVKPIFKTLEHEGLMEEGVTYTAYLDELLKMQEMSKRQIRRYKKGKY